MGYNHSSGASVSKGPTIDPVSRSRSRLRPGDAYLTAWRSGVLLTGSFPRELGVLERSFGVPFALI